MKEGRGSGEVFFTKKIFKNKCKKKNDTLKKNLHVATTAIFDSGKDYLMDKKKKTLLGKGYQFMRMLTQSPGVTFVLFTEGTG